MYTYTDFKTKKALKEAVKSYWEYVENPDMWILNHAAPSSVSAIMGVKIPCAVETYQPGGMFPATRDGNIALEGPHYPKPHTWYASAIVKDGIIVKGSVK